MNKNVASKKKPWDLLIKSVIVVGLLYVLVRKGLISVSVQDTHRALMQWDKILPAAAMMFLSSLLGVVRWQWLLRAQDIHLSWARTFQLTFIGNFFNIALPGAVSGDFVKAFYIGREIDGKRARAFGSILFDRVAGLSALVLVSAVALALGFESFWGTPMVQAIRVIIIIAAVAVIAFYGYLFLVREQWDPLLKFFKKAESRFKKLGSFTRIYEGIRHYHNHKGTVTKVLAISFLVHTMIGCTLYQFAQAYGETQIAALALYVVFPLGLLVTAIPVMPAGIGTGHAAFFYLFKLIGTQRGADIFTLWALFNLCIGGMGGLIYLRFRTHEPKPAFDSVAAESAVT